MLKYLDVLIGLALVMLLAATVALSISQALLDLVSARSRHLQRALERLVQQVHPAVLGSHAPEIARLILMHPLVGLSHGPLSWLGGVVRRMVRWLLLKMPPRLAKVASFIAAAPRQPARVVLREEFAICLLEWASAEGSWSMQFDGEQDPTLAETRRAALVRALRERGIEDPAATLRAVKLQAMTNEREHPDQSAEVWRSQALAQCAPSEFLSSLYMSFDNTMNRATTSFGTEAQVWVSAVAFLVVFATQLDAIALIKRLSVDDAYRARMVGEAQQLTEAIDNECKTKTVGCAPFDLARAVASARGEGTCNPELGEPGYTKCRVKASAVLLSSPTLDLWPNPGSGPKLPPFTWNPLVSIPLAWNWMWDWAKHYLPMLPGILLAWILVSLGAPFWFDVLKNLFKLRSLLAQKDDADRGQRDTGTKPTATIEVNKGTGGGGAAPAGAAAGSAAAAGSPAAATAATTPPAPPQVDGEMGDLLATGGQG